MIAVVKLPIYLGCPCTSCILVAPLAASHIVGIGGELLLSFSTPGARETGVIHSNFETTGP
jgi:hypothetical protein